jgi:hypothetical protein
MAQYRDLEIDQGSDVKWEIELQQTDGTPRDLTNYTIVGNANRSYDADSSELFAMGSRIITPSSQGVFEVSLTNIQTEQMNRRRYVYDIEVLYIDSDAVGSPTIKERVLEGNIMVSRSVSKFD